MTPEAVRLWHEGTRGDPAPRHQGLGCPWGLLGGGDRTDPGGEQGSALLRTVVVPPQWFGVWGWQPGWLWGEGDRPWHRGTAFVVCVPAGSSVMFYLAAAVSDFYIPASEMPEHKIQSSEGPLQVRPPPRSWPLSHPLLAPRVFFRR